MPEGNHSLLCNFVFLTDNIYLKKFEDTEGVIRIRKMYQHILIRITLQVSLVSKNCLVRAHEFNPRVLVRFVLLKSFVFVQCSVDYCVSFNEYQMKYF
jgi:hypothetical protein